ncbi:hypothetical protein MRX96_040532 [Rhipicephalus microplus]
MARVTSCSVIQASRHTTDAAAADITYYSQHQRIVGGEQAGRLEFPWQISLRRVIPVVNQDRGHACGGSIINSRYVLTAAHCVTGLLTFPSDFSVVVGEEDITKKDDTDEAIQVRKIIKHPQWNKDTMENDYALLELKTPLDFEGWHKHLMPICLPEKDQDFEGQNCTISGWGLTKDRSEGGKVPAKLQKVDVPVLKHSTCIEFYKDFHDLEVKEETMICAGYEEGGRSACQRMVATCSPVPLPGDSSVPPPRKPGVYARIATRVDWIRSVVGETP